MTRTRITTDGLTDASVTYAKVQNVAADRLLGRGSTAGVTQEIVCTAAGRALLDDADAAAQRTTLGLGAIIDVGGNVGIGTTSPTSMLTIGGTGDRAINRNPDDGSLGLVGGAAWGGANPSASIFLRGGTSSYNVGGLEVYTGATERIRVLSTGNVGIGTASPAARLDVRRTNAYVLFCDSFFSTALFGPREVNDGFCTVQYSWTTQANGGAENWQQDFSSTLWQVGRRSGGTFTSGMFAITSTGNVGIGTTTPATNLHVVDATQPDIRLSGAGSTVDLFATSTHGYVGTTSDHPLVVRTNNVDRWRMGSDGALSTTAVGDTANTLRPAGHVRAWARWTGTITGTNSPVRSFNVTSVTRSSLGLYLVNLGSALSSDTGVAVASAVSSVTLTDLGQFNNMANAVVINSTTVRVSAADVSNVFQDNAIMGVIVCDL
jgi:hypothetical protein